MPTRLRAKLYQLLRRIMSQEQRNRLKRVSHTRASAFAPMYRGRYGTFVAEELRDELADHVPPDAEIVMVHCSLNDLQPMYIGGVRNSWRPCASCAAGTERWQCRRSSSEARRPIRPRTT